MATTRLMAVPGRDRIYAGVGLDTLLAGAGNDEALGSDQANPYYASGLAGVA
jgi:Ca2+-binding RTX toxin-like protein